ncbi:MAG TPA: hypothetical protein VME42_04185 [Steroidobacteraceae bacterium]|nr:hypothetical protein [Steroidobacteraceae bacterium]
MSYPVFACLWALLLGPVVASAGVVYDFTVQPVDQNFAPGSPGEAAPTVTRYFVVDDMVRAGGPGAKTAYIFKNGTVYVIDGDSRSVRVFKHATLSEVAAHYAEAVKQLEDAAASAPPEDRAQAQRRAADMKEASDRLQQPVARDFRMTARFESVGGHDCRIWEESEDDAKRLELCVAPVAAVPGGAEILDGMKTLSRFRRGSSFALGVDFGLSQWWSDIGELAGVPLLIREFKFGSVISEVRLTAIRPDAPAASLFVVPGGYRVQDVPDYAEW